MNGRATARILLLAFLAVLLLTSCGHRSLNPDEEVLCGRWAYDHDPENAVLTLKKDGRAVYEGTKYEFSSDGQYIRLDAGKGEEPILLRYVLDGETMILYQPAEYEREETAEGLAGHWTCAPRNWTYDFSEEGAFKEDGTFSGEYDVDEDAGTFTLHYEDYFDDTTCFYSLDGTRLTVEYPWAMVRMK